MTDRASSPSHVPPPWSPFVLGGRPHLRPGPEFVKNLIAWSIVAVVIVVPLKGLYVATGASMEEGFMMVFPNLVGRGAVPNVDFLHLYGPASLDSLSVWYRLFGDTLESQRIFGFGQHLAILSGLYTLARAVGRVAAVGAAVVGAMFVLTPIGLTALAWHGAIGLGMWAAVFAARYSTGGRRIDLGCAAALGGLALAFRPDVAIPTTLVLLWAILSSPARPGRREWAVLAIGGLAGLLPMWVHLIRAGVGPAFEGMFMDPVFRLRPGRELPTPPSWGHVDGALQAVAESLPPWWGFPALAAEHQLFFWFWGVIVLAIAAVVTAIVGYRRATHAAGSQAPGATPEQRQSEPQLVAVWKVLLTGALFGVGIVPQALQRPDSTHLAWVAMVSWPLWVPLGGLAIASAIGRRHATERASGVLSRRSAASVVASLVMAVVIFVVCPFYTYRTYVLHARVSVGALPTPFVIERGPRHFWVGDPAVANAMAQMIPDLDARSQPGDRLFVGPGDLSKTVYADTYLYWLFDELEPATYFIEMDPGLANAEGSGMDADVASADFVVLTNTWSGWIEPNTSVDEGSQASNQVIADEFCLIDSYETNLILLFERCEEGDGINPADVAGRAEGIGGGGVPSDAIETPG